jgi:hypothetical protein
MVINGHEGAQIVDLMQNSSSKMLRDMLISPPPGVGGDLHVGPGNEL